MSKITHVSPHYFPHYGGVEKHVEEVSKLLAEDGHGVNIVTLQDNEKSNNDKVSKTKYKFLVWSWIWKNRQIFIQSDIIHVHDVFWWILPIWPFIRKKVFITFHGWEGVYPIPFKNKLQRLFWSKLSKGNIHVGDYIREFYWDKPDLVTYGGVKPLLTSPLASERGLLRIVFVGRLEKVNDIEAYINLLKELKKKGYKLKVTWLGDGTFKSDCEKFGQVLGNVKDQERYISKADLVFANSYLSILKAQAMGKVVLSLYSNKLKRRYLETWPGADCLIIQNDLPAQAGKFKMKNILNILTNSKKLLEMQKDASNFAKKMTWDKVVSVYTKLWEI